MSFMYNVKQAYIFLKQLELSQIAFGERFMKRNCGPFQADNRKDEMCSIVSIRCLNGGLWGTGSICFTIGCGIILSRLQQGETMLIDSVELWASECITQLSTWEPREYDPREGNDRLEQFLA